MKFKLVISMICAIVAGLSFCAEQSSKTNVLKLTDFDNDIYITHYFLNDNTLYNLWFEIASSSRSGTPRNDKNGVCMSLRGCPQTAAAISTAESVSLSNLYDK